MKAVLCTEWGPPERLILGERPEPRPGAGEVRIAVRACGVNFADTLLIEGKYQERPSFPFSPGLEIAGEVLGVGAGVGGLRPGDRVLAICGYGGFAEQALAPARTTVVIPESVDFRTAAAFAVAYGTAHVALEHRAGLAAGETLLVHGAAGGVGLAAVEVGKAMGATVIAAASSQEKRALALAHGATHVLDSRAGGLREQVKGLTGGRGVDVVFDPVGGELLAESLRCLTWEGRLLVIGFASGSIPQVPANLLLVKNISVVGVYWGGYASRKPEVITQSLRSLFGWHAEGRLRPHVSTTYPLARAADALRALRERRATGKIVLDVGSP